MTDLPILTLNNGVALPALGLGVFHTPPDETRVAVAAALQHVSGFAGAIRRVL